MKDFFLKSKHYILFIPLILPTLVSFYFQFLYMNWISGIQQQMLNDPGSPPPFDFSGLADYKGYFLVYLVIFAIANFIHLGWWHTVSTKLRDYLPTGTNLKPNRFKLAFTVACIYIGLMLGLQYFAFDWFIDFGQTLMDSVEANEPPAFMEDGFVGKFIMVWAVAFFGSIIGLVATIYTAYYAGKTLRCIEYQKPQQGSAVAGYAVLAYFLLIGVWIFQPKIHRLLETGVMKDPEAEVW